MLTDIRKITKTYGIPLICDEVQSGLGRSGSWWAYENFSIEPDIMSSAKALQVGAAISNKGSFGPASGSLSSTWGGGQIIDLATGNQIIKTIKKRKLLAAVKKNGAYLKKGLEGLEADHEPMTNVRGLGLMLAFDMRTKDQRNSVVLEMLNQGIVLLGTGVKGIRVVPPYIVTKEEIRIFVNVLDSVLHEHGNKIVKHKGEITKYLECSTNSV